LSIIKTPAPHRQGVSAEEFESGSGRIAQKRRTRNDLLRAARAMRDAGRVPTVADAATAAGISRATAYRYFPTQESLLAEASTGPLIDIVVDVVDDASRIDDVVERVDAIFAALAPLMLKHEAELRSVLKVSLERSLQGDSERELPLRSARWVLAWDDVLAPLRSRVSTERYATMVRSLSALLGVEAILVLRDACDLDSARAVDAIRRAARAMVRGFLLELEESGEREARSANGSRTRLSALKGRRPNR
jgi:AcrR family transcriptional regulator